MECETPVYTFEWMNGKVTEAVCPVCGNEDPVSFVTEEELEEMATEDDYEEE